MATTSIACVVPQKEISIFELQHGNAALRSHLAVCHSNHAQYFFRSKLLQKQKPMWCNRVLIQHFHMAVEQPWHQAFAKCSSSSCLREPVLQDASKHVLIISVLAFCSPTVGEAVRLRVLHSKVQRVVMLRTEKIRPSTLKCFHVISLSGSKLIKRTGLRDAFQHIETHAELQERFCGHAQLGLVNPNSFCKPAQQADKRLCLFSASLVHRGVKKAWSEQSFRPPFILATPLCHPRPLPATFLNGCKHVRYIFLRFFFHSINKQAKL